MKNKINKVVIGTIIVTLITSTIVFAGWRVQVVERFYKDIKIVLNGKEIIVKDANQNKIEPFIIEGTTYLPVRGIASALGISVEWDSKNNKVILNSENNNISEIIDKTSEEPIVGEYATSDFSRCVAEAEIKNIKTQTKLWYTSNISLEVGDESQLSVYNWNNAESEIVWSSENKKIATVDEDGYLIAKKSGKTIITAKNQYGTQSLNVTVYDSPATIKYDNSCKSFDRKDSKAQILSIKLLQRGEKVSVEGVSKILIANNDFSVKARLYDAEGCYLGQSDFNISRSGIKAGETTRFSADLFQGIFNTISLKRGELYYIIFE